MFLENSIFLQRFPTAFSFPKERGDMPFPETSKRLRSGNLIENQASEIENNPSTFKRQNDVSHHITEPLPGQVIYSGAN